jgi:hypothetical protein
MDPSNNSFNKDLDTASIPLFLEAEKDYPMMNAADLSDMYHYPHASQASLQFSLSLDSPVVQSPPLCLAAPCRELYSTLVYHLFAQVIFSGYLTTLPTPSSTSFPTPSRTNTITATYSILILQSSQIRSISVIRSFLGSGLGIEDTSKSPHLHGHLSPTRPFVQQSSHIS